MLAATWSFAEARFCSADVTALSSWVIVPDGAPAALSSDSCAFASASDLRAFLSWRLPCATVELYDDFALASWFFALVSWSFAVARELAVPPAASFERWVWAFARFASAWVTASSAVVVSATARTSPALTVSPTLTSIAVTGQVTVTDEPEAVAAFEALEEDEADEAADVEPVLEADEDAVAEIGCGSTPNERS